MKKTLRSGKWLVIFAVVCQTAFAAESPFQRVVVIGASASAGFVLLEPFGGPETSRCKLNYFLDAAIVPKHEPVKNFASALLFLNPDDIACQQIISATNARPTLVVAADFLFWFCYGEGDTDAARGEHFETGLKLLESLHCHVIVGDIPDASSATNTGIIVAAQVPSGGARQAANRRLREWATGRPQVTVLPLAEFMRVAVADEGMKIHGQVLPAKKSRALLQFDGLHPKPEGAAWLALGIFDAYFLKHPKIAGSEIRWDEKEVFSRALKLAPPPSAQKK